MVNLPFERDAPLFQPCFTHKSTVSFNCPRCDEEAKHTTNMWVCSHSPDNKRLMGKIMCMNCFNVAYYIEHYEKRKGWVYEVLVNFESLG